MQYVLTELDDNVFSVNAFKHGTRMFQLRLAIQPFFLRSLTDLCRQFYTGEAIPFVLT